MNEVRNPEIPDVEALKYHGGDTPDIKIFVSTRIEFDSFSIPNPLFIPVRDGAFFDKRENVNTLGDNTGDNISDKKNVYNELTVQYWAWKNIKADYYGLCHYRRFFSYAGKSFPKNTNGLVEEPLLSNSTVKKYGLTDKKTMRSVIAPCDLVVMEGADVHRMHPLGLNVNTVRQMWEAHDGLFFYKEVLQTLFSVIDRICPMYSAAARSYFDSGFHYGYNCYVMKAELLDKLCRFQFPVLAELKETLSKSSKPQMPRTIGYMGEILFGIFTYYCQHYTDYKVKEIPLVFFAETEIITNPVLRAKRWIKLYVPPFRKSTRTQSRPRDIADKLFPVGSSRREALKKWLPRGSGLWNFLRGCYRIIDRWR